MPPFVEYLQLQLVLLKGGDRLVNLVQVPAFLGLLCATSLIARELGAGQSGQALAALITATIPVAVLESSGANNDVVFSFWIAAMTWFVVRYSRAPNSLDVIGASAAFALALLTKGTAIVIATPLLLPALPAVWRRGPRELIRVAITLVAFTLAVNGPFQYRIARHPEARFAFTLNASRNIRSSISNVLRVSATLMGTSNRAANLLLYRAVASAHAAMHQDLNDPSTTFLDTKFRVPEPSRLEETAPDAIHIVMFILALAGAVWLSRREHSSVLMFYCAAICIAFLFFCAVFRYQPYHTRLVMPLLALAAAVIGLISERILPPGGHAFLVLFLIWSVTPYLLKNELRPLIGPANIFVTDRIDNYFRAKQLAPLETQYRAAENIVLDRRCNNVGVDFTYGLPLEYPLLSYLRTHLSAVRFYHPTLDPSDENLYTGDACAIVCLDCADVKAKDERYRSFKKQTIAPVAIYWASSVQQSAPLQHESPPPLVPSVREQGATVLPTAIKR